MRVYHRGFQVGMTCEVLKSGNVYPLSPGMRDKEVSKRMTGHIFIYFRKLGILLRQPLNLSIRDVSENMILGFIFSVCLLSSMIVASSTRTSLLSYFLCFKEYTHSLLLRKSISFFCIPYIHPPMLTLIHTIKLAYTNACSCKQPQY